MPIGRKMGSMKGLKDSLKKGGDGTFIKYIPKDGAITVRFLEDPEEWVNYNEHFDEVLRKSFPCIEDGCPGCETSDRRTSRYLANAVDVEHDRVIPIQMPKTLVSTLVTMYERMGTVLDRDFELVRSGEGLDTTYNAIPDAPMPRKMDKYTPHDLEKVLDDAYMAATGVSVAVDDDDDVDDEPTPIKTRSKSKAIKAVEEPEFEPDVDDDDDEAVPADEPDVDGDDAVAEEGFYDEDQLKAMPLGQLRAVAKDYGINSRGLNKLDIIEAILNPEPEEEPF